MIATTSYATHSTDNVPYRTPEGTPIELVHTHHGTSSRVQVVVPYYKLHHVSMSFLSSTVNHVASIISSAMEQRFHSESKVFDRIDMAPCCSKVQDILSCLQKRKENMKHRSGTGVDMQLCMCEE